MVLSGEKNRIRFVGNRVDSGFRVEHVLLKIKAGVRTIRKLTGESRQRNLVTQTEVVR